MRVDEIVKAALLGTDKYMPQPLPELGPMGSDIAALTTGKEDKFLKLAATTLLMQEAGRQPKAIPHELPPCPAEKLPVAGSDAENNLRQALSQQDDHLLLYFLYRVHKKGQVLPSAVIPYILNKATGDKKRAAWMTALCGETGVWLCTMNSEWKKLLPAGEEEDIWETGGAEQRRVWLARERAKDPLNALALLEKTIGAEGAAAREKWLELLQTGLSLADEPFLVRMLEDKAVGVKKVALQLLQRIQGSAINQRIMAQLLKGITVREERYMLIAKRKVLSVNETAINPGECQQLGLEMVSSDKGVSDALHLIRQMMVYIDPARLATELGLKAAELIDHLLAHADAATLAPALNAAAARFRNRDWALALLNNGKCSIEVLDALPPGERRAWYPKFITESIYYLMDRLLDDDYTIMEHDTARQLLEHLAANPYNIQAPVYKRLALHLPDTVRQQLGVWAGIDTNDYQVRYLRSQAITMLDIMDIRNNTK